MTIKDTVIYIIAGIGYFFSVVFYVLFQLKKDENKILKAENNENKTKLETLTKTLEIQNQEKKENETLLQNASSGNTNASLELLHKLTENGKKRNKN